MPPLRLTLDDDALTRLFALWSVPLPPVDLVLFALRGAVPLPPERDADSAGWVDRATLETATPDHVHMRCTLGIWNRATRQVFVARGSTVPHRDHVLKAAARKGVMKGRGTNQLEPGYYTDLTKGEHLQGKPQGHAALRQTGFRFYRRAHLAHRPSVASHAPAAPLYTARDPLFFGNPYDNLHCAWNVDPEAPGFRSAGCLVVAGWPHSPRLPDALPNRGAWKSFHDIIYAAPQQRFPLLLLPARDAAEALAARPDIPGLGHTGEAPPAGFADFAGGGAEGADGARLLYGSEGAAVRALQRTLTARGFYSGRITGRLGAATYRAWDRSRSQAR